jgi:hypothetical protein
VICLANQAGVHRSRSVSAKMSFDFAQDEKFQLLHKNRIVALAVEFALTMLEKRIWSE